MLHVRTGPGLAALVIACAVATAAGASPRSGAVACVKRASDLPDLAFRDTNCDGLDGDAARAVFVSTRGSDSSPGTRARPKKSLAAAVALAARSRLRRQVIVEAGTYDVGAGLVVPSHIQMSGGYRSPSWRRSRALATVLVGRPQAVLVGRATGVVLQLLRLRASVNAAADRSVYGLRAVASSIVLERVTVVTGPAADGPVGAGEGTGGAVGAPGNPGSNNIGALPGTGGSGPGGSGGSGGAGAFAGGEGFAGVDGSANGGGKGGAGGKRNPQNQPGNPGDNGGDGATGAAGATGAEGSTAADDAGEAWMGKNGLPGGQAQPGGGGGGGGGGSGYVNTFGGGPGVGGGGGGAGGTGGTGGAPGGFGGGSFAIYLWSSSITIRESSLTAGAGGRGGSGRAGGAGGAGGNGAPGGVTGQGGDGGRGGRGGDGGTGGSGGGGAGGPSTGVFQGSRSQVTLRRTTIAVGTGGVGGGPNGSNGAAVTRLVG